MPPRLPANRASWEFPSMTDAAKAHPAPTKATNSASTDKENPSRHRQILMARPNTAPVVNNPVRIPGRSNGAGLAARKARDGQGAKENMENDRFI